LRIFVGSWLSWTETIRERETSLYASMELSSRRMPEEAKELALGLDVFRGGAHVVNMAHVLKIELEEAEGLASELIKVGSGSDMGNGYLRLDPALPVYMLMGKDQEGRVSRIRRWERVARVIMDPEELKERAREALDQDHEGLRLRHELEKVEKEREDLQEKDQRAMELYLNKKYDKSALDNILGKLRRRQKDAEILEKELKDKLNDRPHIAWEDAEEHVDRYLKWLSSNSQEELQGLLQETADVVGLDLKNEEVALQVTEAAGSAVTSLASWKKNVFRVLDAQIELAPSGEVVVRCGVELSMSPSGYAHRRRPPPRPSWRAPGP